MEGKNIIKTKKPFRKTFLGSLLIIGLVGFALYWLFFASLGWVTNHGEEQKVPSLVGKSAMEATSILEKAGFDIEIDSTYSPDKRGLTVMAQQPESGATVKNGRTIFLTVNKTSPPNTPMPNLVNMSFRSAEMLLGSNKLLLGDTILKPDLAQGAVLEQLWNGKPIAPGTLIPQGSTISLVIGDGLGNKEISVPDLTGMTYPEAIAILSGSNLNYTVVFDGVIADTTTAQVYMQLPEPYNEFQEPNRIVEGDNVDIRIKQHYEPDEPPAGM
ncbi:MAG: PASTA domain-containing protein [Edaphocola sp.]